MVGYSGLDAHTALCYTGRAYLFSTRAELGGKEGSRHSIGEDGHADYN